MINRWYWGLGYSSRQYLLCSLPLLLLVCHCCCCADFLQVPEYIYYLNQELSNNYLNHIFMFHLLPTIMNHLPIGFSEAVTYPVIAMLVSEWAATHERTVFITIIWCGGYSHPWYSSSLYTNPHSSLANNFLSIFCRNLGTVISMVWTSFQNTELLFSYPQGSLLRHPSLLFLAIGRIYSIWTVVVGWCGLLYGLQLPLINLIKWLA